MKTSTRLIILITLVILLALTTAGAASAKGNPKGEVTAVDQTAGTVTIQTEDGQVNITLPSDIDYSSVAVGDTLMAKGTWQSDTELIADWVKVFPPKPEDDDKPDTPEKPDKEDKPFNSAFCDGTKETFHPLAEKLAAKYGESTGVTAEQIQAWYCEGNSIGQIMLALMTQKMVGTDAAQILAERKYGEPWGKIWKDKGLIGSEKDAVPPGQLKKPDNKIPPGQQKKTEQP